MDSLKFIPISQGNEYRQSKKAMPILHCSSPSSQNAQTNKKRQRYELKEPFQNDKSDILVEEVCSYSTDDFAQTQCTKFKLRGSDLNALSGLW